MIVGSAVDYFDIDEYVLHEESKGIQLFKANEEPIELAGAPKLLTGDMAIKAGDIVGLFPKNPNKPEIIKVEIMRYYEPNGKNGMRYCGVILTDLARTDLKNRHVEFPLELISVLYVNDLLTEEQCGFMKNDLGMILSISNELSKSSKKLRRDFMKGDIVGLRKPEENFFRKVTIIHATDEGFFGTLTDRMSMGKYRDVVSFKRSNIASYYPK